MTDALYLERRRQVIGGSDAPAVCGVSPEATPADVWAEKLGIDGREPDQREPTDGNSPMVLGKYIEGSILDWTRDRLGMNLIRGEWLQDPELEWRAATLDARSVVEPVTLVEVKTCGLLGRPSYYEDFGDDGTDQVPLHVLIQLHHQADVVARAGIKVAETAHVAALLGGRGFKLYTIPLSAELIDEIRGVEINFWARYVRLRICPEEGFSREVARRIIRTPGLRQTIDKGVVMRWQAAKLKRQAAQDEVEHCELALWNALGLAEIGESEIGEVKVSITNRKGYTVEPASYTQLRFTDTATLEKRAERAARKAARDES